MPFKYLSGFLLAFLILTCPGMHELSSLGGAQVQTDEQKTNVYIAFGFHVNLYHSFRGDNNDESGFGKDISNIRHILKTLNHANAEGIPVRGSWDFDNHFSLEKLIPQHAPDIITEIRQRVEKGHDEVLLMSYNNGLVSAMNHREMTDAVSWSISNPWGSGIKDLFNEYSPVVRPQEMMSTPGIFNIYKSFGIKAVSLYYSAVPFDAFRMFSRPLTKEEAHNPLTYRNDQTREEMTIIPTYHVGDLVENVSLRNWVEDLHQCQNRGQIKRDVLLFINFDADSDFWKGAGLNWPVNRLPNTRGLKGLIDEVSGLGYVKFTTLKDYLKAHRPAGTVSFQQDTADGSFDGYNSWAEKKQATDYWTRIAAARRVYQTVDTVAARLNDPTLDHHLAPLLDKAYLKRLAALSTTNFGMATPFVAPQREKSMLRTLAELDSFGQEMTDTLKPHIRNMLENYPVHQKNRDGFQWLDNLLIVTPDRAQGIKGARFIYLPFQGSVQQQPGSHLNGFYLQGQNTDLVPLIALPESEGRQRFYITGPEPLSDGIYSLYHGPLPLKKSKAPGVVLNKHGASLANKSISVSFDASGKLETIRCKGKAVIDSGSLVPYFRYEDKVYAPSHLDVSIPETGRSKAESLMVTGRWEGPDGHTLSSGSADYSFSLIEDLPYLFVEGRIQYPGTSCQDVIKADVAALSRPLDMGWQETAPAELRFLPRTDKTHPVRILKHNFFDVDSTYTLDYFRHSEKNLTLDDVNNHITDGYAALVAGGKGIAVSADTTVAANFAFAPVKIGYDRKQALFNARINPFGTYYGKQYHHPTWGNRQGFKGTLISGEQFCSSAPTFNGRNTRFSLMLCFFDQDQIPDRLKQDLLMHSNPAMVFSLGEIKRQEQSVKSISVSAPVRPEVFHASFDNEKLVLKWKNHNPGTTSYNVLIGQKPGIYSHTYHTDKPDLSLERFSRTLLFKPGKRYYVVIEAEESTGTKAVRSDEIPLDFLKTRNHSARSDIPIGLGLQVLWANLKASLR